MEYKTINKYKLELVKDSTSKYAYDTIEIKMPKILAETINNIFNLENQAEEVLVMLCLNTKNRVIGAFEVSRGALSSSIVHPREVFKRALLCNASSICLGHNHPSGDTTPSNEDINITKRLKEAGKIIGINVLDHIIIGENKYISLKEKDII